MSISEIAIKRPLLIVVIFTILILFGAQSYLNLNYNLLPKMEVKTVSVNALYPGASAAEVETNVTKKLEDALSSLEGLDIISATSQEGASQISISLTSNADLDKAERDVQRKVQQAMNTLPENIEAPIVSKVNLEEIPVINAAVTGSMSSKELYNLIDTDILPILQNTEGVGQVNIIGGDERQIQVNIDPEKLRSYNLDITQVALAINNANRSYPAGNIETVQQQFAIKFDANVTSIEQIRNLIVSKKEDGGTVSSSDNLPSITKDHLAMFLLRLILPCAGSNAVPLPSRLFIILTTPLFSLAMGKRLSSGIPKENCCMFLSLKESKTLSVRSSGVLLRSDIAGLLIAGSASFLREVLLT
ncbi:efflux RND transporter permease subunit [Chryseobacterium fluminis]|uniref:efflux RND transporter permease subunit n=1 Tax=Chryseobacterium fluminis TaxID=2983606 RepID=UPI0022501819|nr:efflux RND transporter permease subunit [Chryseobacterium sp. MMS21-Ot14]UZT99062.1 efflux RND transporter permease subunit [Chryseobacterium sp. MMS21-Ot14]